MSRITLTRITLTRITLTRTTMTRTTLIALVISSLILLIFTFVSQQYRTGEAANPTPPIAAAAAAAAESPLPSPVAEASYTLEAPAIQFYEPTDQILQETRPTIYLAFDQPMDQAAVANALTITPTVALEQRWIGNTLYLQPYAPLAGATIYTVTVATTAQSQAGLTLQQEYQWSYRSPTRLTQLHSPMERDDGAITLTFDHPIVPQPVTLDPPLLTTVEWLTDTHQLLVWPAETLQPETQYTVTFAKPPLDHDGYPVDAPPMTFTTPKLIQRFKYAWSPVMDPLWPITVDFSSFYFPQLDREATTASLKISPPLSGTVTWQENSMVFKPIRGYLAPKTNYSVSLAATARNARSDTQRVLEGIAWSFRTAGFRNWANFGHGPHIQAVTADDERLIHFQRNPHAFPYLVGNPDYTDALALLLRDPTIPQTATLTLHALTVDEFRTLFPYAEELHNSEGHRVLDETRSPQDAVARWEADLLKPQSLINPNSQYLTTRIPNSVAPGLYLLSLETGYINDQLLVLVTDHAIVLKQSTNELFVWVSALGDGSPLANLPLALHNAAGNLLLEGTTDQDGLFRAPQPVDVESWYMVTRQSKTLNNDGKEMISVVGNSSQWHTAGTTWLNQIDHREQYTTHLYTDRPIYRPGQTVHFKGILRRDDDAVLTVPPDDMPVTVRLRDARQNIVRTYDLNTNERGTIHGDFVLADGAMLGTYQLESEIRGMRHQQPFHVQAYHKPDFTVDVTVDAPDLRRDAPVTVTVTSRYLNGKPVVDGGVTLNHFLLDPYQYGAMGGYAMWTNAHHNHHAITDAQGQATIRFSIGDDSPFLMGRGLSAWAVEATVRNQANQIAGDIVVVESSQESEQLTMSLFEAAVGPNSPVASSLHTEFSTATILPNTLVELHLQTANTLGSPAPYSNLRLNLTAPIERPMGPAGHVPLPRIPGVWGMELTTNAEGALRVPLHFEQPGFYQLQLTSYDNKGHGINPVQRSLLVYDPAQPWPEQADGFLEVTVPDDVYRPGDQLPVQINSSFGGPALLSIERGTVRRTQLVQLIPPRTVVELPLQVEDAPNIFVTINVWTPTMQSGELWQSNGDHRLRMAKTEVAVAPINKRLQITIEPDQTTYAPRNEATLNMRVVDETGEPVAAELSLALVDDAIFQLRGDLSAPIYDSFYGPRLHNVATYDGMAPTRNFGGGRGGGGGGGFMPGNPRWHFPDTALWLPSLQTDATGEITVTVKLPDTLTTWRTTAKAVTAATQVGEASVALVTSQPVSVQPLLPTALTSGDQGLLSVLLHNNLATTQTMTVSLMLSPTTAIDPLTLIDAPIQQVTVGPKATGVVGWSVRAEQAGTADLIFSANTATATDTIRLPLPVYPTAIRSVDVRVGDFAEEWTTTIMLPITTSNELKALHQVNLELSRSLAGSMLEGLEYLTGYPYGCVEQTMSRALPNAVVGRAFRQLGVGDPLLQRELPDLINAGVQRLYGFQTSDGGWGWWHDSTSDPYQTAWVVFGLALTAEAGYEVDEQVLYRGINVLKQRIMGLDQRTQVFALYAINMVEPEALAELRQTLVEQVDQLDAFSQAALALILMQAADEQTADQVLAQLAQSVTTTEDGNVYWPLDNPDGSYSQKMMASSTRTTALALSAFTAIRPNDPLIPGMVRWLMDQRQGYGWGNTNETAFTLLALTDHLLATTYDQAEAGYQIWLNDTPVMSGTMDATNPSAVITLTGDLLNAGTNQLRITADAGEQLYYRLVQQRYTTDTTWKRDGNLTIYREYVDPETREPLVRATVGQLVQVQLTMKPKQSNSYMLIEDRLPGGLTAINETLATDQHALLSPTTLPDPMFPNQPQLNPFGTYDHKEIRDDHVTFFVTAMPASFWQVTYLARATTSGTFVALPAEAYAMYDLAQWGRSASSQFRVESEIVDE